MSDSTALQDAWLDIDVDEDSLFNPLSVLSSEDMDDFQLRLAWFLSNPEYFTFIVKNIFNIDLLPVQALMLKELWSRKFPMLIASRGFGKSFILSLYAMMRAVLLPPRKIVIVGAAFSQS